LLGVPRDILLAYAQEHRLAWVEDESNSDVRYTRNFLRREILPQIASRFPRARDQLAAAAARFSEAQSLLDELAIVDLDGGSREFPVSMTLLRNLSDARARNLLRAMLSWRQVQPPDERRLKEFVRQLRTVGNDRHPRIDLASYSLWREAGLLHFKATV
jgi:tRNA(Ile)-lysidine synthase